MGWIMKLPQYLKGKKEKKKQRKETYIHTKRKLETKILNEF